MDGENTRTDRWQHLVSGAFGLDELRAARPDEVHAATVRYLESVLEVFPNGLDPVEDFEGYAVRRAALSLLGALDKLK